MIEHNIYYSNSSNSSSSSNKDTTISNISDKVTTPKCSSCCCNKVLDIEDSLSATPKLNSSNHQHHNGQQNEKKIIIQQKINNDQPIHQQIGNISNSLYLLSQSAETIPQTKEIIEALSNSNSSIAVPQKAPICTCHQSSCYPFCDQSHEKFNNETNSNISPIYLSFDNGNSSSNKKLNNSSNNSNSKQQQNNSNGNNSNLNKTNIKSKQQQQQQQQKEQQKEQEQEQKPKIPLEKKYKPGNLKNSINSNNYFSLEEIAQHNTLESCWMIISNKVYDITDYISHHPGGKNALLRFAGKDGTENVQFHSSKMLQILNNNYFIGHLNIDQQTVEPSRCTIV
ncbi:hypothetical protein CYY_009310 [Polysphondylium violaceum]|uniref:Cytochrome b5 heme-binding domain-containing protein n=1 Tax=Polysphondylium violaceum TaxID=133409 RepID=A0A8J4PN10_9MYCE|nr:hypothetical protein CYY_009310 [Polysphondylium violaceum]